MSDHTEALRQEEEQAEDAVVDPWIEERMRGFSGMDEDFAATLECEMDAAFRAGMKVAPGFRAGKARRPEVSDEAVEAAAKLDCKMQGAKWDAQLEKARKMFREHSRKLITAALDVLYGEKVAGGDEVCKTCGESNCLTIQSRESRG